MLQHVRMASNYSKFDVSIKVATKLLNQNVIYPKSQMLCLASALKSRATLDGKAHHGQNAQLLVMKE